MRFQAPDCRDNQRLILSKITPPKEATLTNENDLPLVFDGDAISPALEESLVDTLVTKCESLQAECLTLLNRAVSAEEQADAFRRCLDGIQPIHPGPYLFEFSDFEDWCDFAQSRFKNAGEDSTSTICLDRLGRTCWRGKDFQQAHDDETFPVKVFSLRR